MKTWLMMLGVALVLTGCGTTPASLGVESKVPTRRVLATASATLWGVTFDQTHRHHYSRSSRSGGYFFNDHFWNSEHPFSGPGTLEKLSLDRFAYQVPEDEVLVINHLGGQGVVFINGYGAKVSAERQDVHYVFGPGQTVFFRFAPGEKSKEDLADKFENDILTRFHTMTVSGYVGDPALLGGAVQANGGK